MKIDLIDRISKKKVEEKVFFGGWLRLLYSWPVFYPLRFLIVAPFVAKLVARFYETNFSSRGIDIFIKEHDLDPTEFVKENFDSFQDFFIREILKTKRPTMDNLVLFADARYSGHNDVSQDTMFKIKGTEETLRSLLKSDELANKYQRGSFIFARLCPSDCHRFFFPCRASIERLDEIKGALYSVNPYALKNRPQTIWQNKRHIVHLKSEEYGDILYVIVGATFVGSIVMTSKSGVIYDVTNEMGYFKFGASAILVLFERGKVSIAEDIVDNTKNGFETLGLIGQPLSRNL